MSFFFFLHEKCGEILSSNRGIFVYMREKERTPMSEYQTEVQRLRVVLEKVVNRLEWWVKKFGCADVPGILFSRVSANEAIREAREALSTTTEPTGPSISKTQIENIKKMFNDPAYS